MVTLFCRYISMILTHHNMLEIIIIWPHIFFFLQINIWDNFPMKGNDANYFQHFLYLFKPLVCSIFAFLMLRSATWPLFEINGHTGTLSQILAVSIFAWLEKCFHLFAHDLFSSSLEVLYIFCNSFCEQEISRADCKSMVSCRSNAESLSCSYHTRWSPQNFPLLLFYDNGIWKFYFQVDMITSVSIVFYLIG